MKKFNISLTEKSLVHFSTVQDKSKRGGRWDDPYNHPLHRPICRSESDVVRSPNSRSNARYKLYTCSL